MKSDTYRIVGGIDTYLGEGQPEGSELPEKDSFASVPEVLTAAQTRRPVSGSIAALTDGELVEGIRTASEPHFNELYNRYFRRV